MPTYEYGCKCGRVVEDFQPIPGKPTIVCPDCWEVMRKRIGPGCGVIFKGSGFYATDYRKKEGSGK